MDIALLYNPAIGGFDIMLDESGDLVADEGLKTATILSLFLDRRAEDDDDIPDGTGDRRGWWADAIAPVPGDKVGSRAWLLEREKETADVRRRAQVYDQEALNWMIEDGIAERVEVDVDPNRRSVLAREVRIIKPGGAETRFNSLWENV